MSFITTFEHAFSVAIGDIKKAAKFIETAALPALKAVHAEAPTIEAITALVSPQAANIERTADAALGALIKAIEDAGAAAEAGGLSVTLDAALVADIKAITPAIKAAAAPNLAALAAKP